MGNVAPTLNKQVEKYINNCFKTFLHITMYFYSTTAMTFSTVCAID